MNKLGFLPMYHYPLFYLVLEEMRILFIKIAIILQEIWLWDFNQSILNIFWKTFTRIWNIHAYKITSQRKKGSKDLQNLLKKSYLRKNYKHFS